MPKLASQVMTCTLLYKSYFTSRLSLISTIQGGVNNIESI